MDYHIRQTVPSSSIFTTQSTSHQSIISISMQGKQRLLRFSIALSCCPLSRLFSFDSDARSWVLLPYLAWPTLLRCRPLCCAVHHLPYTACLHERSETTVRLRKPLFGCACLSLSPWFPPSLGPTTVLYSWLFAIVCVYKFLCCDHCRLPRAKLLSCRASLPLSARNCLCTNSWIPWLPARAQPLSCCARLSPTARF